jgi:hypothetical protein
MAAYQAIHLPRLSTLTFGRRLSVPQRPRRSRTPLGTPLRDQGLDQRAGTVRPITAATSSLSGFSAQACFPRITPATCANDGPLETVGNRSVPMACGPNVDHLGTQVDSSELRCDSELGGGWGGKASSERVAR